MDLPGILMSLQRAPQYATGIREGLSGLEHRTQWWNQSRQRYQLSLEFARLDWAIPQWQRLVGFYERHVGRWDSFLFEDPEDCVVEAASPMPFGTGDGVTTAFQIQRSLAPSSEWHSPPSFWPLTDDGFEPIGRLQQPGLPLLTEDDDEILDEDGDTLYASGLYENLVLYADGVPLELLTDYTITATGAVTFLVAPADGVALTWSGRYYWRVRFDQDGIESSRIVPQLWEVRQVVLVKVI